jgi:hypothetical protein
LNAARYFACVGDVAGRDAAHAKADEIGTAVDAVEERINATNLLPDRIQTTATNGSALSPPISFKKRSRT